MESYDGQRPEGAWNKDEEEEVEKEEEWKHLQKHILWFWKQSWR